MKRTYSIIALGGNVGDTEKIFENALESLSRGGFEIEKVSTFYVTHPVGCETGARDFVNGCVGGFWKGTAFELLSLCQKIECEAGRPKDHPHWVSRVLDLDIIIFGDMKIDTVQLKIPHPLALERDFVMKPLMEILPDGISFPATK